MYSMGDGGVAGERESKLATWVAEATGAPIERIFRRPGGGRNEAWDVEFKQQRPKLFLRVDMGGGAPYETYTLRREAEIYDALHKAGIPVPEVIAVHSEIEAVLLGYVEGAAPLAKLPVEQQHSIVDSFVPWIAKMHALDVNKMHLPTLGPVGTIKEHVARELDVWETRLNYHVWYKAIPGQVTFCTTDPN
jgi:aminoglycoside phosphotransferase (APT) family kinase protein